MALPPQVKILFDTPVKGRFVRILPQTFYNHMSMRAAVLLCERQCLKETLIYTFHDSSLLSTTKGPRHVLHSPLIFLETLSDEQFTVSRPFGEKEHLTIKQVTDSEQDKGWFWNRPAVSRALHTPFTSRHHWTQLEIAFC